MKTNMMTAPLLVVLAALAHVLQPAAVADNPQGYPIGWPAFERIDLLPLLPPNGTQTKQFISYDTSGGNGYGFQNFRRYEQDGEWVFFDEIGPGALYRLQMNVFVGLSHPADQAHIRFRFDDEKEPRIDMTFAEFFGKHDKYPAPWTPPLAYFDIRGTRYGKGSFAVLYYPFTFAKRLRVSAWHPNGLKNWDKSWYQFTYLKFPSSTKVTTWKGRDDDSVRVRDQWEQLGSDPKPATTGQPLTKSVTLAKGATAVLLDEHGAGSLTGLRVAMKPWNRDTFTKVRLRITWDDQSAPMVDLPVGCFFGGGGDTVGKDVSGKKLTTLLFGFDGADGTGYSHWPMPFWSRARIEVVNESQTDLELFQVSTERAGPSAVKYDKEWTGYLAVTRTLDVSPDHAYYSRAFHQRGYGKVMGLMMYSAGYSMDGDEFTYIDGSRTPQIHGDGTEDDHNQGWGGYAIQKPLWGGLINGFDGAYRLYLAEPYVYHNQIRITYEHSDCGGGRKGQHTDFVIWSYQGAPGIGNLQLTDSLDVGDPASETAHRYQVTGETWTGLTAAAYDKYEQGNPFPLTDNGRSFTNATQFTMKINPANEGVRLRRRLNRSLANVQQANVTVDGTPIADTPWYFCDLPTPAQTAFADSDFEIPAALTRGKKQITVRLDHVSAQPANANNEFHYEAYSYVRHTLPPPPVELPEPPLDLQAAAPPGSEIAVNWQFSAYSTVDKVVLERRAGDAKDFSPLTELGAGATNHVDRAVQPFTAYTYRARTANKAGSSDWIETKMVSLIPAIPNLLRAAKASASTEWDASYVAGKANDGDPDTRWNSKQGVITDQWLAFQLPVPQRMNIVTIDQTTKWTRILDYRVEIMRNGKWQEVAKGESMPDTLICPFSPVTTDGVRIWMGKTTGQTPTINEVNAFLYEPAKGKNSNR